MHHAHKRFMSNNNIKISISYKNIVGGFQVKHNCQMKTLNFMTMEDSVVEIHRSKKF